MLLWRNLIFSSPQRYDEARAFITFETMLDTRLFILLAFLQTSLFSYASIDGMFHRAFGDASNPAIYFLHGGPGYNSATFESFTATKLADAGYYVIVYDRMGEGRSVKDTAAFSLKRASDDLAELMNHYKHAKASFIGHSFGGMVAVHFAKRFPERVENIFLVGAPVNLQESFSTILANAENYYLESKDSTGLAFLNNIRKMDRSSLFYANLCFMQAMKTKAYSTEVPTAEAKEFQNLSQGNPLTPYFSKMETDAPMGYFKNNNYTNLDLSEDIKLLVKNGVSVFGIYGSEDGLYSTNQLNRLKELLLPNHFVVIEQSSHSVFIDQRAAFIERIKAMDLQD
jgi:proline iminopeptidase